MLPLVYSTWRCSARGGEKSLPEQRNTRITVFGLQLCIRRSTESKAALPLFGGVATMLCTVVIRKPWESGLAQNILSLPCHPSQKASPSSGITVRHDFHMSIGSS